MPAGSPLSTPLSHVLVAFTIELDNEFERRFAEAGGGARVTSLVMWSNFLRFVGDGITVGELPAATGIPKSRTLSTLGGMERWRYVFVGPGSAKSPPKTKRDGYGSARAFRSDWVVRVTPRRRDCSGDLADVARRHRGAVVRTVRRRRDRRAPGIAGVDRRSARRRASPVPPDPGELGRLGRRRLASREERAGRRSAPVGAPVPGAPRLHARLRARVGAVAPAERELRARPRRVGCGRSGPRHGSGRVEGGDEQGPDGPTEGRLRRGGGCDSCDEGRAPDVEGSGSARARSRATCEGRGRLARRRRPPAPGRAPGRARSARTALARARAASRRLAREQAVPRAHAGHDRRPDRGGCPTTRWCCTAAGGRTGASRRRTPRAGPCCRRGRRPSRSAASG